MTAWRTIRRLLCVAQPILTLTLYGGSLLDSIAIEVKDRSREFAYTNKVSAFYYGETNLENRTTWQGFNVYGHKFLDDYAVTVNGSLLERKTALKTIVYPDYLKRIYPNGISEEFRLADSIPTFGVIIKAPVPIEVGIIPYFSDGRSAEDFTIEFKDETALLARNGHLSRSDHDDYPVWLAIHGGGFTSVRQEGERRGGYSPFRLNSVRRQKRHMIAFAVADNAIGAERAAIAYAVNSDSYARHRRERLETLLRESSVETSDKRLEKALVWAKLSLDALIMDQVTKGIFAGLPWFNNYWGRDTFVSLPGATLVTGRFGLARQILQSFAAFQQTDSNSTDYGRIPNLVTTSDKAYNTADGPPRFVMMTKQYIERSGDSSFIVEIYPSILRSIEGTLKYHVDRLGFLTHGDAETWMDAVGPGGPWSPRGNRANDIQALWDQQLEAGVWFATRVGDVISARRWYEARELLRRNFSNYFIINGVIADHLKGDGTRDNKIRPNQLFVFPIVGDSMRASIVRTVVDELTYEYGVASLSQRDEDFHPFHQNPPYYPKDAAYHNGTVWTWLQGPLISQLCAFGQQGIASLITANTVHQILDRGAVGTQSELLDAVPRPGEKEPRLSGTFSQAWNLAEFVRNFYDDYLGIRVDLLERSLSWHPHLPIPFGITRARVPLGNEQIDVELNPGEGFDFEAILSPRLKRPLRANVQLPAGRDHAIQARFEIDVHSTARLQMRNGRFTLYIGKSKARFDSSWISILNVNKILGDLKFVRPHVPGGLKALIGPGYPLLSQKQIKTKNPDSSLLIDAMDPVGDDVGNGSYTYPRNPSFRPGSFDITRFTVRYDNDNAYFLLKFKDLSDPGWHPEYGFQLTFAAIAIDEDEVSGSGGAMVARNANFPLRADCRYERIIFVGGGLQLENSKGDILAAYVPVDSDAANPLGDAHSATISFAIPLRYLGTPAKTWRFTVLAGAQDDHGGAGIGEFRTVNREAGEWNGGGKRNPGDSNVYDTLIAPPD